jgi:hypothetical protein
MTAEFDWWLLIVGLVAGAGLVWLILAEWPRRDEELADDELELEAGWIAAQLGAEGRGVEPAVAEAVLRQHRAYLRLPPPEEAPASASIAPVEEARAVGSPEGALASPERTLASPERTLAAPEAAVGTPEDAAASTSDSVEPAAARHAASASAESVPREAEAISTSSAMTAPTLSDSATGQRNQSTR